MNRKFLKVKRKLLFGDFFAYSFNFYFLGNKKKKKVVSPRQRYD